MLSSDIIDPSILNNAKQRRFMSNDQNLATYSVPIKPNTALEGIFLYSNQRTEKEALISEDEISELRSAWEKKKMSAEQMIKIGQLDGYTLSLIFEIPDSLKIRNRGREE